MAALISTHGGRPIVAPALREIPLESNVDALRFSEALIRGEFDLVILLTGVGTRALLEVVQHAGTRDAFVAALARTKVVPRGPKPMAVLREIGVPAFATVPEPNTWRELVATLDASGVPLHDAKVAVQEYGVSNPDLLLELEARGARLLRVPVYRWALPDDVGPLEAAVRGLVAGEMAVVLFTTSVQVAHLLQVAGELGQARQVCDALGRLVVASIGPTTSEALRERGLAIDLEASHPKMGVLVREAAERGPDLLRVKRAARA
jgi:uroporphyrinogen-III synthase